MSDVEQLFDTNSVEPQFNDLGRERLRSERRQLGGLMLLLATCAVIQPLVTITSLVGIDDSGATTSLQKAALAAGLIQIVYGCFGMFIGYLSMVHDYGNFRLSGILILLTQLAWMPFITGMVDIGRSASGPYTIETKRSVVDGSIVLQDYVSNPFVPEEYLPTQRDVRFFGAMGILGILSYGTAFLGSLAFTEFAIYAFDSGKPMARDATYYRSRLLFYVFVLIIAGMSQLLLGAYTIFEFGSGPLRPAVGVAMYRIYFPEISMTIGSLQMLIGYYGVLRYLGWVRIGPTDHQFQGLLSVQWIAMLVLQYIVQIGHGPGDEGVAAAPTLTLLSVGLNILPAFLDYKMRTMPRHLTSDYYGLVEEDETTKSALSGIAQQVYRANTEDEPTPQVGDQMTENQQNDQDILSAMIPQEKGVEQLDSQRSRNEKQEPSARQDSRKSIPNDDINMMYEDIEVPRTASNKGTDEKKDCLMEPSARMDSRSVDINEATNQMYEDLVNEPELQLETQQDSHERLEPSERINSKRNEPAESPNQSERTNPAYNLSKFERDATSTQPLTDESLRSNRPSFHGQTSFLSHEDTGHSRMSQEDAEQEDTEHIRDKDEFAVEIKSENNNQITNPLQISSSHTSSSLESQEKPEFETCDMSSSVPSRKHQPLLPDENTSNLSPEQFESKSVTTKAMADDASLEGLEISDDSSAPDDSTAVLEAKLEEIENEIFTESMGNYAKSLQDIL